MRRRYVRADIESQTLKVIKSVKTDVMLRHHSSNFADEFIRLPFDIRYDKQLCRAN